MLHEIDNWQPVSPSERVAVLDVLRGLALVGVLLVNVASDFRVPIAEHILHFHTDGSRINRAADITIAALLEFKAMSLFSLLFGAGAAIFAERAAARGVSVGVFLARRYLALLAFGLIHLLLIWNGDILTLYALCGFLLLPCLRLRPGSLALIGVGFLALGARIDWGFLWPSDATMHAMAAEAARVYAGGGAVDVLRFHGRETRLLILPLLATALPRTLGLMALGAAAWRGGLFRSPERHRETLQATAILGLAVGGVATGVSVWSDSTGKASPLPAFVLEAGSFVPLALAYAAGLTLALRSPRWTHAAAPFAAAGQMALTNYLSQSALLGLIFYGYGLGLAGGTGSAAAAGIGLLVYLCQVAFSVWWMHRYRFGPVEWLWRSLTYGRRQPFRKRAQSPPPAPR